MPDPIWPIPITATLPDMSISNSFAVPLPRTKYARGSTPPKPASATKVSAIVIYINRQLSIAEDGIKAHTGWRSAAQGPALQSQVSAVGPRCRLMRCNKQCS